MGAVAVLVLAGLLLWGAGSGEPLIGGPSLTLPDGPALPDDAAETVEALPPGLASDAPAESEGGGINVVLIAQVVLAALVAWLVLRWFRNREPDEPDHFADEGSGDELDTLVQATTPNRDLEADLRGEPRNAVVACWVALEDALAGAGAAPKVGETSLDVTQRVLHRWQVEPAVVTRLADLFREARFSRHPITADHAQEAATALQQIHAALADAAALRDRASSDDKCGSGDDDGDGPSNSSDNSVGMP